MRFAIRVRRRTQAYATERLRRWRHGSASGQQWALGVLAVGVGASFVLSLVDYDLMPLTAYVVWSLLGVLLLRFWPLVIHACLCLVAGVAAVVIDGPFTTARYSALLSMLIGTALVLYHASRQRGGLPAIASQAMLVDLKNRLQAQSRLPELPAGWRAESAMIAAEGGAYAGDFLVADLDDDERHLEMILVDVCGKGVQAGTQALSLSGALSGLIGALPPVEVMAAANAYLLRQHDDESFATAVHVRIDLVSGDFGIVSAGHPPVLRYAARERRWRVDSARGLALGIDPHPELVSSRGTLGAGEALLFYTDGVIESRGVDIDEGIDWLAQVARREVAEGFGGAPVRILREVRRGDDDRAVLMVSRRSR